MPVCGESKFDSRVSCQGGVVQNYQSLFYAALGFQGKAVLLISGCYGFMGVIGQVANMLWVSDKWPRVRTMCESISTPRRQTKRPVSSSGNPPHPVSLTRIKTTGVGSTILATFLSLLTAMSRYFGDGSDTAGAAAGVACIFLYSACYAIFFNSTVWVIVSEIFPQHLRGNGNSLAVFSMSVTNIWLSQITPIAFDSLEWKFYFVFIALNLVAVFIYWMWLPETNQLSLEEIAGVFGDDVAKEDKTK